MQIESSVSLFCLSPLFLCALPHVVIDVCAAVKGRDVTVGVTVQSTSQFGNHSLERVRYRGRKTKRQTNRMTVKQR